MSAQTTEELLTERSAYKYGFATEVETESLPKGLSEETIREISRLKGEPQFLLDFRLKAYSRWLEMEEP
ncbi:MAG: Fe-S cluster assembly protein SufB, partial [Chlamydiia bacterium]|nr:Fe-S cluster assembly protein SufB [Chlamydiia bacterium]